MKVWLVFGYLIEDGLFAVCSTREKALALIAQYPGIMHEDQMPEDKIRQVEVDGGPIDY
jgi:hypothetical protein